MAIKYGSANKDNLQGAATWDLLYGLAGDDLISGGGGRDILSGGDGNDTLDGGAGSDSLHGGAGADVFRYSKFSDASGDRIVDFGTDDTVDFSAISGANFIGNNSFAGNAGEIRYLTNGYYGYNNQMTYIAIDTDGDTEADVTLQFNGHFGLTETAKNSLVLKIANDQTLNGTNADDPLTGGAGNDSLFGIGGNDLLKGGEGEDLLDGGNGNDTLEGGLGSDSLIGGAGDDIFRFSNPEDFRADSFYYQNNIVDIISDFSGNDRIIFDFQGLSFIGDAGFTGVPGEYAVTSNGLAFDFDGDKNTDNSISMPNLFSSQIALEETTAGSNILKVAPNQNLTGKDTAETLTGGNGYDRLFGNGGNDSLFGGGAKDTLNGGDGNDTLFGGPGADNLTGGAGNDSFIFNAPSEFGSSAYSDRDTISDFAPGDKIDLSKISGLSFVGLGNDFSGIPNQTRILDDYNSTQLQIDINGDKTADYTLLLPDNQVVEETTANSKIFQVATNKNLPGNSKNETLTGGNGHDVINGIGGNDSLVGGFGNDTMNGGDGNDTLVGGLGNDSLTGGAGSDTFIFKSLAELSSGTYNNNDVVTDLATGDKLDFSAIPGLSFVGLGNDFTGAPNQVRFQSNTYSTQNQLQIDTNGDRNADFTIGLPGVVIEETSAGSRIYQIPANKVVSGTSNNESLAGGNGNDSLDGGAGDDSLQGGYGADTLIGGDGADTLLGGLGADNLTGGTGNDVFKYMAPNELSDNYGNNRDTLTDFSAGDKVDLSGIAGISFVGDFSGGINQVRIVNNYNNQSLEIDTTGDKYADYSLYLPSNLVIEETTPGSAIFQVAENKVINGDGAANTLTGGAGNDSLSGNAGNDSLTGSSGNDTLDGGDGNDALIGGLGMDSLTGGTGNDTFKFNSLTEISNNYGSNMDSITDLAVGDKIDLSAITGLTFAGIGNNFTGVANQVSTSYSGQLRIDTNGDSYIDYGLTIPSGLTIEEATPGSSIYQVVANKTINGTTKAETLTGGNGNDLINGNSGADSLVGGYGADSLNGGDGADTLVGGLGADSLTGGGGNDVFKFTATNELNSNSYYTDIISDLAAGDKIDLSGIDADPNTAGDQAFVFSSTGYASGTAGSLYYYYNTVYGDINADYAADFSIAISGSYTPTATDFIL